MILISLYPTIILIICSTNRFGITPNRDVVLRATFAKYHHPKEALLPRTCISHPFGTVVSTLHSRNSTRTANAAAAASLVTKADAQGMNAATAASLFQVEQSADISLGPEGVEIVYPYGCTLTVSSPAVPVMSSGLVAYPVNCPILAFSEVRASGGRVAALGSIKMLSDDWFGREHNSAVLEVMFRWLLHGDKGGNPKGLPVRAKDSKISALDGAQDTSGAPLEKGIEDLSLNRLLGTIFSSAASAARQIATKASELDEDDIVPGRKGAVGSSRSGTAKGQGERTIPDISALAQKLKPCLQAPTPLPSDFSTLLNADLYKSDALSLVPEVLDTYKALGLKHEPLAVIPPEFKQVLPPLQPSVFPPCFRDLPGPSLELFDLDAEFSTHKHRLAHLANTCTDAEAERFVREAGVIIGITPKLREDKRAPRHVLEAVLRAVVGWKRVHQDIPLAPPLQHSTLTSGLSKMQGSGASQDNASYPFSTPTKGPGGSVPGHRQGFSKEDKAESRSPTSPLASLATGSNYRQTIGTAGLGSGVAARYSGNYHKDRQKTNPPA